MEAGLITQDQLAVLNSLLAINSWNPGAGRGLVSCIFIVARAIAFSLETAAHKFSSTQLIQVGSCFGCCTSVPPTANAFAPLQCYLVGS